MARLKKYRLINGKKHRLVLTIYSPDDVESYLKLIHSKGYNATAIESKVNRMKVWRIYSRPKFTKREKKNIIKEKERKSKQLKKQRQKEAMEDWKRRKPSSESRSSYF